MDHEVVQQTHEVKQVEQTTCCVVGGGPAGAVLSYMLARKGIDVMLLESHVDFDRDFRGDTLHPSILEVMDELGLADRLLQLPHTKVSKMTVQTLAGPVEMADLSHLHTKFPYITLMPQSLFLDFLTREAQQYQSFHVVMGARAETLIEEEGEVRGVGYRGRDGWHEVRALLTVGADGRFSKLRMLAHFQPKKASPPMDVLWFRLPRMLDDPHGALFRIGHGHAFIELDRGEQWQVASIIPKGSYQQLHTAGLERLRQSIVETVPEFKDRVATLTSWKDFSVLSVEADRLPRWYRPGLLLIGDAAHVMSPAGGNGINYAIQDAVATANRLSAPLTAGHVSVADLARVQQRREWPVRFIQALMNVLQDRLIASALDSNTMFRVPGFVRWPFVSNMVARLLAFGILPEHVKSEAKREQRWAHVGKWVAGTMIVLILGQIIRWLLHRLGSGSHE